MAGRFGILPIWKYVKRNLKVDTKEKRMLVYMFVSSYMKKYIAEEDRREFIIESYVWLRYELMNTSTPSLVEFMSIIFGCTSEGFMSIISRGTDASVNLEVVDNQETSIYNSNNLYNAIEEAHKFLEVERREVA